MANDRIIDKLIPKARSLSKRTTIKEIRRRIGLLFAEWEAEERAGGIPAKNGYLYAYAIGKGFSPHGASLIEEEAASMKQAQESKYNEYKKANTPC